MFDFPHNRSSDHRMMVGDHIGSPHVAFHVCGIQSSSYCHNPPIWPGVEAIWCSWSARRILIPETRVRIPVLPVFFLLEDSDSCSFRVWDSDGFCQHQTCEQNMDMFMNQNTAILSIAYSVASLPVHDPFLAERILFSSVGRALAF